MKIRAALLLLLALPAVAQDRDDLKKARAALRQGDYDSAARMFERLSEAKPDAWEPRAGWTRALLETGKVDEAGKICDAFLASHAKHSAAVVALASVSLERGDPARALELLEPLQGNVRARALAARALEELDRLDEAMKRAEPFVDLYAKNRDDFMKDDLFAIAQGLLIHARHAGKADLTKQVVQGILPELLQADPGDAAARSFLGRCFLDKYNRAAAAESFKEALQANPNYAPALLGFARLHLSVHDPAPALKLAARALEINPGSEEAHAVKAEALFVQGDRDGALAALDRGLESQARSIRLLALRSAVRHAAGDPDASKDADRAFALRPSSPLPEWETARLLLLGGGRAFDEAQSFFKKAVARKVPIPDLLIDTGMNSLRVGEEETAKKLLEEAFARDPFNVRVVNSVNLLHDLEKDFVQLEPAHFRLRLARADRRWQETEVTALLERAWGDMARRYGFAPAEPVLVEVFPRHSDFSVRTMGVPGLGALGACFGRVVTTLAPRSRVRDAELRPYRWAEVLWHEMAHVFALQLSGYRVPSWFTEGLATYEEGLGFRQGRREAPLEILLARHRGLLGGVASLESGRPPADPILNLYLQGAEICRFIVEERGFETIVAMLKAWAERKKTPEVFRGVLGMEIEEFDRRFLAWLDARLAKVKYRRPARGTLGSLQADATADPKNAESAARLSFALLDSGDEAGAEKTGARAVEADPASAVAHAAYGQALLKRHQIDDAIPHLKKGTDDYQNWDALGRALGERSRWPEAIDAFRRAAACAPFWIEDASGQTVHHRLNAACLEIKDYAGAQKALEDLVSVDALDFGSRLKLARLYQEKGEGEKLEAVLREAAAIEPRQLELLDIQASLHRSRKDWEKSTERTLAAIAIVEAEGKDEDGRERALRLCAVGEDWLARGDKAKAADFAQEALRLVSGLDRARTLYESARPK